MRRKKILICLILVFLVSCFTTVLANDIEDLQNRKKELQNEINESNEQIQEIQDKITENLEQLNRLNGKIEGYVNDIKTLSSELNKIEKEIQTVENKLKIVQENYDLQQNALKNRIVALYESGDVLYLDVLLSSSSISDFISNYYLIGEIARYDEELLHSIENQKEQIEYVKSVLNEKKENVKTIKENKEKTTIALKNSTIIRNSYVERLTEQEKETQNKIDEYQKELNDVEMRIVALALSGEDLEYVGGEFAWPSPRIYYNNFKIWI